MTTFLSFIGILAILFFGKFVYDTFLTDNTENDWNDFKKSNPDEARRIENNKGLNFNTSPKRQSIPNPKQEPKMNNLEAERLDEQGSSLFAQREFGEAIEFFNRAIQLDPRAKYYHNRGDAYYKNNERSKAKSDYHKVISLEPDRNERNIHSKLAGIYLDAKEFDMALTFYDKAIKLSPERYKTLYNRAVVHLNMDNLEMAISDLRTLLSAEPNDVQSYIMLANLLLATDKPVEAKKVIDDVNLREATGRTRPFTEDQFSQLSMLRMKCAQLG